MTYIDLTGQVALVTGGTRGIGRAIALSFAACGADVVVNYLHDERSADATLKAIQACGREGLAVKANVGDPQEIDTLVGRVRERFGRLNIVVSNAALGVMKPALDLHIRHWQKVMQINAGSLLTLTQCAVPLMASGGNIVAISSLGASRAIPYYSAVGASKAALESLVRHLALELAPHRININTVAAGVVETDALRYFPNRHELIEYSQKRTPAGRLCSVNDVANAVLFLVSPLAGMIHGQTIVVDGGYSIVA